MAGTKAGGAKAAKTNKEKHGADFYSRIALESQKAWNENGRKDRGFAVMPQEKRVEAGRKGGRASRRTKA